MKIHRKAEHEIIVCGFRDISKIEGKPCESSGTCPVCRYCRSHCPEHTLIRDHIMGKKRGMGAGT